MATGANTTFSVLGADVVVTGNIASTVDIHIDGRIEGDLKCANLVQGEASEIKGSVVAETARLSGMIDGSIEAKELIIERTARITGDVVYQNVTIASGGKVEGKFSHRRNAGESARAQIEQAQGRSTAGITNGATPPASPASPAHAPKAPLELVPENKLDVKPTPQAAQAR